MIVISTVKQGINFSSDNGQQLVNIIQNLNCGITLKKHGKTGVTDKGQCV